MSQGQANPNVAIAATGINRGNIFSGDYAAADEGSFFVSTLAATASTSTACTSQALANTNPSLAIFNGQSAGGYNLYLRYIKVKVTAVGASNTSVNYSFFVENVAIKLDTTGTALGTPVNVNTNSSTLSKMTGNAGVLHAVTAGASGRQVGDGQVAGAIEVAFDEWIFDFASPAMGKNLIGTTTIVSARTVPCSPIILAPGWWLTVGFWGASDAAAAGTYGWEVGFIERPAGQ